MKAVCFSDTHKLPIPFSLPAVEFGIFAGDCSLPGRRIELDDFLNWYATQPVKHKIFVAGNHDWFTQRNEDQTKQMMLDYGIIYLRDSGVEIDGYKFYGTPVQPFFCNWAWNEPFPEKRAEAYDKIPQNLDVLITHCPPFGILDTVYRQYYHGPNGTKVFEEYVGCPQLHLAVKVMQPKFHVFGHIHCSRGMAQVSGFSTRFVNAAICDEDYYLSNTPIVIDLDKPFSAHDFGVKGITSHELSEKRRLHGNKDWLIKEDDDG